MDGSVAVSLKAQMEATIAAIGRPAALVAAQARTTAADDRAEALLVEIRELTAAPESNLKEEQLGRLRVARVKALADAGAARVAAAPLLSEHRLKVARALQPLIDQLVARAMEELDGAAERLKPVVEAHNLLVREAVLRGATVFGLPEPILPAGFTALLDNLVRYEVARSREAEAAGGRRRGIFGRSR